VVFTGTKASVYGGGALKGGGPGTITKVVNNSNVLTFGQQAGHNETYWQGQLDEIRLEKAVRSADWIKLCYETQRIGATLSQSGVEIASPGSDFQAGAGTMLSVEIHDLSGAIIASDTSTMITFTPTKHGTITGVTEGTGDGGYGVAAGAETVTVRNGRATILLNDWQADTFAVVITNSAGLPNAAPDTIVVTTAAAPVVTVTPADTTIPEGRPITIIAQVVGSRPLTYRWTVAGSATVLGADSAFEIAAVTAADSGHYICAVTNASGTGADTAVVRVATAPKARFTFAPQNPLAGAAIGFADSSAGSIAQWRWSFGDGTDTTYDARMTAVSHVYSDTGRYVCKLTVIGTLATMRDSITAAVYVSRVGENPVRLEARVLSSTRIELTFKGIKSIPTDPLVSPHADKLYCWFGRSGLSRIDTLPGRKFKEYSIATMLAAMGNDTAYTDIVTVPAPILLSDSIYGFWASPLWNGIRASPFGRYNAVGVRMAPVNNLTVNGQYLGNSGTAANPVLDADKLDSVRVLLGNAGSIDTAGVQSVVIAYRLGSAGPFDIDTLPALDVVQAGAEFAAGKRNPLFMEDTIQLEVSAWLIGKNLQISEPSADTFMVGWPYPANPCSLRVEGRLTANQAPLVWNNPGNVDSVRILYGVGPVPLGQPDEWKYLSLSPSRISDTGLLVIGLEPSTHYYFAIQVRKDLHWSNVTIRSRADVVTPEYGTGDSIDNTIAIDSLWFAQAENALHIRWHAQPLALITRNMGVRISGDSALARNKPPTVFDGCVVSPLSALSGEMTIDMAATIAFNDTLYAGLWLQNTRGPWSQPTDSSFGSFTTPDFTWQRISYFGRNDTVRAFNGTVLVRKDSLYQVPMIVDTVTRYYPPDTIEGLLPLSIGFSLKKENIQSFYVGLRYDSLPSNVDISDLGVYRDSAGRVLVEYAGSVDTASRTVWAFLREQNSRSGGPFFVMADTLRPRIFIVSDTGALVTEGQGITDRFTVRDNIGNVRWRLLYSRDGRPFRPTSPSGYLCGSCDPADTAAASVDGWFVTGDNGLLSLLIVSDGVHTDTVNLSRQARRENADAITTLRNCWTPLSTTTELDNPGVSGVLRSLVPSDRAWVYMPARFRMFQWLVTDENRSDTVPQKWVEYSNRDSASFSFLPGRTRWLKTIEPASFNFGSGRSASLKKAVEVPLNPGEWTDIAVPYHFDVRAADILQATGIAGDSLEIYKWVMDTVPDKVWGGEYATFVTHPLYISGAPDAQISDPAIALTWQPLVAYSVYCWPRRSITLRIPPVSAELSAYQPAAGAFGKARDVGGWSAKVVARTVAGRSLNTVYCGYATGPGAISYHPQPPGFLPLKAGIYDARQQRIYGHGFAHRLENGGLTFAVSFANYGDKVDTILYHVEPGSGFPAGFTARMYDPVTGAFSTMGRDTSLVLRASERVLRILTIGTEAFVSSAAYRTRNGSFALVGCSMNPASNGVLIRYRVPMIGVSVVKFRLYDMSGRQVWRQSIDRRLHAGVNTLAWNGISQTGRRVSTGMYILSMQAYDRNGRITGVGKAAFAFVR
jgi:PKD repeat protein